MIKEIRNSVARLSGEVGGIIGGTEEQFLYIGSRLNEVYNEVENISKQASSLVGLLESSAMEKTIGQFQNVLDRMETHIGKSDAKFDEGLRQLKEVQDVVSKVGDPLANFRKIVKKLKILSISTKIESAQLKRMESDFANLAGDVEQLSALINEKSANIDSHRGALMSLVKQTLARVVGINEKNKGYVNEVLRNIKSNISLLENKRSQSFSAADSMLTRFNATSKSVGEVVMSMQFHDITRQQVEHIRDVLDTMEKKLAPLAEISDENDAVKETAAEMAEIAVACELQKAQLVDAKDKFTRAVSAIMDNMKGVITNVFKIIDDVQKITGTTDLISTNFFSNIESGTAAVIEKLEEGTLAGRELSDTMESLSASVSAITGLVEDIEEIGEEIELIAVNARVKAAHTGSEGAPLGVIAEAIQHLSMDATSQKVIISELLRKVITATEGLRTVMVENVNEEVTGTGHIIDELAALLTELKSMNDNVVVLVHEIESKSRGLSDVIVNTIDGITVHNDFANDVDAASGQFNDVFARIKQVVSEEDLKHARGLSLKYIEKNYTMQRERIVHQSIAAPNVIPFDREGREPVQREIVNNVVEGDEFGDNVELF